MNLHRSIHFVLALCLTPACGSGGPSAGSGGSGGSAGGGGTGGSVVGTPITGSLVAGAGGEVEHPVTLADPAWYRAFADASEQLALAVFDGDPTQPANSVAHCLDRLCVVDWISINPNQTYIIQLTNQSGAANDYQVVVVTFPIPALVVNDSVPSAGTVQGHASQYFKFDAATATRHTATLEVAAGTTTPVAVNIYDSAGVAKDNGFLNFAFTMGPSRPAELDHDVAAPAAFYLKVENFPDPFNIDSATSVDFTLAVTSN